MNKIDWQNYKQNNLKLIYKTITESWCNTLPYENKLIKFLKKFSPDNLHYKLQKLRFLISGKPVMPTLEYVVTTKCTMNCKHCNTFIPYFTEKTHAKPVTFEQFKKDIDTLLKAVDYIEYFGFVGGEPMIAKDLPQMIKYACTKKQLHHIFLATNGTFLPDENMIKILKNKKVSVQLSDYRMVNFDNDIKVQFNEYKKIILDNKINIELGATENNPYFYEMPKLFVDKREPKEMQRIFKNCWGQYCNMLCDGLLTQCTISVYMSRNMELSDEIKEELVNIREKKSSKQLRDEIIRFYAKPYSQFCNYCHTPKEYVLVPRGEQAPKDAKLPV